MPTQVFRKGAKALKALARERRRNRRLRDVITDLKAQIEATRRDYELQFIRVAQIQAQLDALQKKVEAGFRERRTE